MQNEWWRDEINVKHNFMVEFDRKNNRDAVFYDIATKEFAEYVVQETGFKAASSYGGTDVKELAKLICGVNLSIGYYDQHSTDERLVVDYWYNTVVMARQWLSKKNLKHFPLDKKELFYIYSNNASSNCSYSYNHDTEDKTHETRGRFLSCKHCNTCLTSKEWYENRFNCTKCGKIAR